MDYRYMPDPNLPALLLDQVSFSSVKQMAANRSRSISGDCGTRSPSYHGRRLIGYVLPMGCNSGTWRRLSTLTTWVEKGCDTSTMWLSMTRSSEGLL